MGFPELNNACRTGGDPPGFLLHNELYELCTRRNLENKKVGIGNKIRKTYTDFGIVS
jgi:hypothetical protein